MITELICGGLISGLGVGFLWKVLAERADKALAQKAMGEKLMRAVLPKNGWLPKRGWDYDEELRELDKQISEAKRRKAKRSHLYEAKEAVREAQLKAEFEAMERDAW